MPATAVAGLAPSTTDYPAVAPTSPTAPTAPVTPVGVAPVAPVAPTAPVAPSFADDDESETSPQDGDQSKHMDESHSYVATFMKQPGRTVVDMPLSVLVALAESLLVALAESLRSDSYPMDDRISWAHRENKTTSTRTTCSPTRCATLTPSTRSTTAASWSRRTSGRGARGRRRSSCASRPARSRSVRPARRQSQTASSRSATPCCWWTRRALHGSTIIREVPPELKEFMQAKLIEDTDTSVSDTL